MDWMNLLSFAAVAALLVVSPGPNGVLIAKIVPGSGRAAGFAAVGGFIVAFFLHATFSILGISAIIMASSKAFLIIKMLGAAYLCWIGFKALRDAWRGAPRIEQTATANRQQSLRASFFEGLLTNGLNPKVSMFYLAAFPQFISVGEGAVSGAYALAAVHAGMNAIWFGGMVILFSRLSQFAGGAAFQRWLKGITGVVFVGFGVKLATLRG